MAAASLAQAYRARRHGAPVILKVQRPGIAELVARDLDMIGHRTRRLEARADWARAHHVADLGRGFADALAEELDFRIEARNIAAVAAAAPAGTTVQLFGYIGLFLSITLILRVVIDILRPRR